MLTGIKVTKRDGRIELLDITKIQKYTSTACEGLENVNQSELELDAKIQFRDLISTEEIQQTLIKTAVDKIDVDRPNWTFVAARLFLYDLYHKVSRWSGYNHLREYFEKGEKEGRIVLGLKEKYDLDDLNDYIKPERDLQFTYLGIKTLYDRYLIKDKQGNPIELPQHMFMAISMFLAQNEENPQEWAKKFYDILSKFEVMAATPTLSNARTPRHQLSSCFLKGTPVKTIDGEIAIDELKIGDYVLTHTKEYKKVEELFIRDFAGQLITLNINGLLREIKATEEHPILSIKKNDVSCDRKLATCLFNQKNSKYCFKLEGQYKNDCEKLNKDLTKEIKWNEIQNLEEGDFVSISFSNYTHNKKEILVSDFVNLKNLVTDENYIFLKRSNCSFINDRGFVNTQTNKIKNKIPLNNNFMLFLGYFLAEGHISKNRDNLTLTFATKEQNYIIQTIEIVKDIFDYEPYIKENTDNSTSVIISNKLIAEFIYQLVKTGFNKKRLTPIIKFADKEVQKSLLIGVIRGDGCAIEEGYQLTLSNQGLIEDLFEIALRCGLSPYMFKGQKNHLANYYPYHLKIGSKNDKNFIFEVDKNIEKINLNQKGNSTLRYFWLENKFFMKITKIETKTINEKVYNIEVEDDHSYSVNFVDVHNCFVGSMNDNIEGIFDDYKEMALLSKFGGGIGWDFSKIRALGSFIDNHKNAAGGVIPWLRITNDIAIAVDQLGCVAKNSYIKVLDYVQTDNFKHEFRKEYQTHNLNQKEILEGIAGYASSFAFKYGKFSKNFIRSLLFDYVMNKKGSKFLENTYNLTHDQYKKIIGKYKKINKGLPEGFETLIDYPNYAISKSGIIINLDNLRPLKTSIDRKGYVRVTIGKNAVQLHLLLAKQFLNYDNTQTIDHIDGDKLNNNLENLQIISNKKNISKGWEDSYKKRTEMLRIRKHLSFGYKLKGDKRDTHSFEIKKIKTKIIPIDKVRIGDLVLSYDIKTNQTQFKPLIAKHEIDVKQKDQIKISFEDGNYIITSNWHPFPKLENKKVIYVRSDSLKVGDITINDKNEFVKISKISKPKVASEFYDLTIKDNNNYFCSTSSKEGNFHLIHNTRKGAIAVYLEPWHMDILDFLELKKNSGEERRRAHDLFPALWLNDLFMKRVENDEFWTLFDPYEVSDLTEVYGEEFEKRYLEYEAREDITKHKVKAKDIWKKALMEYYETGNPFLCFKDNANVRNQNSHSGVIRSSNLCVTGDTRLATQFGLVRADELEKMKKKILATYDYRTNGDKNNYGVGVAECIEMYKTKENADIYKITTKDGYEIKATSWHEFYVLRNKSIIKIPLKEIKTDDKLLIQSQEGQFGKEGYYELGLISGFIAGDGTFAKNKANNQIAIVDLYNEEISLKNLIKDSLDTIIKKDYKTLKNPNKADITNKMPKEFYHTKNSKKIRFQNIRVGKILEEKYNFTKKTKLKVPEFVYQGKKEVVIGYLQGLFTSDSTINKIKNDKIPTFAIQLANKNKEFLKEIQVLLSNFGIRSKISEMKRDNKFKYTTKNGEKRIYNSGEMFRLNINGRNATKFIFDIKLLGEKQLKALKILKQREELGYPIESNKSEKFEVKIEKIEYIGKEDVYDTTQLLNHSLIFNGIVTGNCTEIYQNTEPNHYKIKITFEDGEIELFEEEEIVEIDGGYKKPAKKLSSIDSINGKKIYIAEKEKIDGMTAVCNLASVNLSKIHTKEDFERVVPIAVRMLDNVIDLNFYPQKKVKDTNIKNRAIGLGVMGEAELLAKKQIMWGSDEHLHLIDEIMENFSYWTIKTSAELAQEKGCYAEFNGSNWSKGILPIDTANSNAKKLVQRDLFTPSCCDWDGLRKEVKQGMRNGYLMAIAPTSSISILSGTTQAIEPVYKRKWFEENLSGLIPVVVPNLSPDTWQYYTPAYELDQKILVKAAAIRQKWIDQGQSLNIFIDPAHASGKYLHEIYTLGWKLGIKSFYYLRSKSPEAQSDVMDRTVECMGCQ